MNHYIDIQLKPDAEIKENIFLNQVYTRFHQALSTLQATDIGVSFPRHKIKLGNLLRIHGAEASLMKLQKMMWLGDLSDYCNVNECQPTPEDVKYRMISRKQSNLTEAKLRRLIKRGSISPEEIKRYKAKMFSQGLNNPFLELKSSSNGHHHRRFIQFGDVMDSQKAGRFDQFGLSSEATIPWF